MSGDHSPFSFNHFFRIFRVASITTLSLIAYWSRCNNWSFQLSLRLFLDCHRLKGAFVVRDIEIGWSWWVLLLPLPSPVQEKGTKCCEDKNHQSDADSDSDLCARSEPDTGTGCRRYCLRWGCYCNCCRACCCGYRGCRL